MTTPNWSDFVPNSTFYRILTGFHRTFATGVACRQGTLTPPDTESRPFGTCICSTCWDQSFSELVVILPDYALRISLDTFSILLMNILFEWINVHHTINGLSFIFQRHVPISFLVFLVLVGIQVSAHVILGFRGEKDISHVIRVSKLLSNSK